MIENSHCFNCPLWWYACLNFWHMQGLLMNQNSYYFCPFCSLTKVQQSRLFWIDNGEWSLHPFLSVCRQNILRESTLSASRSTSFGNWWRVESKRTKHLVRLQSKGFCFNKCNRNFTLTYERSHHKYIIASVPVQRIHWHSPCGDNLTTSISEQLCYNIIVTLLCHRFANTGIVILLGIVTLLHTRPSNVNAFPAAKHILHGQFSNLFYSVLYVWIMGLKDTFSP